MDQCTYCGRPTEECAEAVIEDERGTEYRYLACCECNRCEECGAPCGADTFCSRHCADEHAYWDAILSGPTGEDAEVTVLDRVAA